MLLIKKINNETRNSTPPSWYRLSLGKRGFGLRIPSALMSVCSWLCRNGVGWWIDTLFRRSGLKRVHESRRIAETNPHGTRGGDGGTMWVNRSQSTNRLGDRDAENVRRIVTYHVTEFFLYN